MKLISELREFGNSAWIKIKTIGLKASKHLNSFHALHSSLKMDRLSLTFKFSTELIVAAISLAVILINFTGPKTMAASSNLFTKLLADHSNLNPGLYAKASTVTMVIDQEHANVFVPTASAQVVLTAASLPAEAADPSNASPVKDNTIEQENPASIKTLIAEQIKVYDTQPGDTLQNIAAKFGISGNTIIWANNLPNANIKPGWNLVILPTSGVLHKVSNNDTLGDIAKKYQADISKIMSYNGLQDESDIEPGDLLIIPDGIIPAPPKPKVVPKPKPVITLPGNISVYDPGEGGSDSGEHIFPWGQCTWYIATYKRKITFGGNAKNWLANAKAAGYTTSNQPVKGAIVVTTENRRYGHVAYVESIDEAAGTITVSESNYIRKGFIDTRTINIGSSVIRGYIW